MTVLAADKNYHPPGERSVIGKRTVEMPIVGTSETMYLEGCGNTQGWHMAAWERQDGATEIVTYCGPRPKNVNKYLKEIEEGI